MNYAIALFLGVWIGAAGMYWKLTDKLQDKPEIGLTDFGKKIFTAEDKPAPIHTSVQQSEPTESYQQIFVPGKPIRVCMELIGTKVIDETVVKCSQDHYEGQPR